MSRTHSRNNINVEGQYSTATIIISKMQLHSLHTNERAGKGEIPYWRAHEEDDGIDDYDPGPTA